MLANLLRTKLESELDADTVENGRILFHVAEKYQAMDLTYTKDGQMLQKKGRGNFDPGHPLAKIALMKIGGKNKLQAIEIIFQEQTHSIFLYELTAEGEKIRRKI